MFVGYENRIQKVEVVARRKKKENGEPHGWIRRIELSEAGKVAKKFMLNRVKVNVENLIKYGRRLNNKLICEINGILFACFNFLNRLFTIQRKAYSNYLDSSSSQPRSKGILLIMQSKRAAALAELGLAMPVLVVFATLTYQVWQTIEVNKMLDATAREAARYASLQLPPLSNIQSLVGDPYTGYVATKLVPNSRLNQYASKISVNVERLGSGSSKPEDTEPKGYVNPGDVLRVSVNLRANEAGGFYSYLLGSSPKTIVRSAAYVQANPTTGTVEPTPTPSATPTRTMKCCELVGQTCVDWCVVETV